MLYAECHICYEPLSQDLKAVALMCGHVCCASCLERWLDESHADQKSCPFCRYMPQQGEDLVRPVFLKFADSNNHAYSRTILNFDTAIQNAGALKDLLRGLTDLQSLNTCDISPMLEEANRLGAVLQDLYRVRELQSVMSDISGQLSAIKGELPHLHDQIHKAKREIDEQKAAQRKLRQELERSQAQNENYKIERVWTKRLHEGTFQKERESMRKMLVEKDELNTKLEAERKIRQAELEKSEQSIRELSAAVEKMKGSAADSRRKIRTSVPEHIDSTAEPSGTSARSPLLVAAGLTSGAHSLQTTEASPSSNRTVDRNSPTPGHVVTAHSRTTTYVGRSTPSPVPSSVSAHGIIPLSTPPETQSERGRGRDRAWPVTQRRGAAGFHLPLGRPPASNQSDL